MYSTQTKILLAFAVVALGVAGCDGGSRTTDGGRGDGGITLCGDGECSGGETEASCPADCGSGPVCGNGTCEAGETNATCAADCTSTATCGNGTCETGETMASCPADCGGGASCDDMSLECQTPDMTDDDCVSCAFAGDCADEAADCEGEPDCIALINCFEPCGEGDQACIDACVSMHMTGAVVYQRLLACVLCDNCFNTCNGAMAGCP